MRKCVLVLLAHAMLFPTLRAQDSPPKLGFTVPDGFDVSLYADDSLASDIHSLTVDSHGRVVVASKGYIKILHDTKGVGKADKATLFADFPKSGAHGMYFDGDDLICNGDKGVRRLYDTQGVGKCDKVSDVWFPTKNDGEHSANGIVRGPDGWYYMIAGNDAGITKLHANGPRSPVKDPGAGAVVRCSPDGKTQEVVAHGFRNPYALDFNHLGNLFTVDADGERVYHMPYYAPTRLFDIASGMHHGWLGAGWKGSWSRPACWPDNVERLYEIGRGSPTGLVVYRHRQFPERYRNGVFSLCWTFGRLYFFPLERDGSTYKTKMEMFMKTTGDVGFAPTGMAVGPDGDLFIAIGGRGTRGSVFKVSYTGKDGASRERKRPEDPLRAVLAADQPLSSWSRARWVLAAKKLGKEAITTALMNSKLPLEERVRGVEILTELFDGVPYELAKKLCTQAAPKDDPRLIDPELTARVVWSLSRTSETRGAWKIIVDMTEVKTACIARAAWEAILSAPLDGPGSIQIGALGCKTGLGANDRRVRAAAIAAARGPCCPSYLDHSFAGTVRDRLADYWVTLIDQDPKDNQPRMPTPEFFKTCLEHCAAQRETTDAANNSVSVKNSIPLRVEAVRLMQLALGDVAVEEGTATKPFWGYEARKGGLLGKNEREDAKVGSKLRQDTTRELAKLFPTGNHDLDQELARLLGMFGEDVPGLPKLIAGRWTKESSVSSDIHYLLCLARIPGKRNKELTQQTAAALNGIQVKLAAIGAKPADQVPGILEGLLERLIEMDPNLPAALVADPAFGNPGHALYAGKLPLEQKRAGTRKLLASIGKLNAEDAALAWNADLVRLVATLPDDEALPLLRARFADPRLTDTVLLLLATKRQAEDRARFVQGLGSLQANVVGAAAEGLLALPADKEKTPPAQIGKAIRALRRLEGQKTDGKSAASLSRLLKEWTGEDIKMNKEGQAAAWNEWFAKTHPGEAAVTAPAGTDAKAWKKRFDAVDWAKGDVKRGEIVFQKRNCFACHGASRRLGPELTGIAQRFSRDDLFTAIIDPSKDISPAFVAMQITTTTGKVYNGMMIYESEQLYLLQTTPDTTVRIAGDEVQTVQASAISFMPVGLLDEATDGDIADLYAYVTSLRKK